MSMFRRRSAFAMSLLGLMAMIAASAGGAASKPATQAASAPATLAGSGYFRSDRTLEDMKESEAALKEQRQKEMSEAPLKTKGGTYTDPSGYDFRYGLTYPAKVEPGKKYPVFIGNSGWTLTTRESQEKYPCFVLGVYQPETLLKPTAKGYEAPKDYKTVMAAAYKAVLDKLAAEEPSIDPTRAFVEGASKFGATSLLAGYNYPDNFIGIVPPVGGCDAYKAVAMAKRGTGMWFLYGVLDGGEPDFKKAPFGRGGPHLYKAVTEAGYDARLTIYTYGDHHEFGFSDSSKNPRWNDFTRMREWLFSLKRPAMSWPVINSPSSVAATVGQPLTYKITADKEAKSLAAQITIEHAEDEKGNIAKPPQDLPKGLSLDSKTGVISGTPAEAGRFFIRLTASNDKGDGISTLQLVVKEK